MLVYVLSYSWHESLARFLACVENIQAKSNYWPHFLMLLQKSTEKKYNRGPFHLQYFSHLFSLLLLSNITEELLKSMRIKWCQCLNWPSRGHWVHWLCSGTTAGPLPQQRFVSTAEARVWFRDFQYTSTTLCCTEGLLQPQLCISSLWVSQCKLSRRCVDCGAEEDENPARPESVWISGWSTASKTKLE